MCVFFETPSSPFSWPTKAIQRPSGEYVGCAAEPRERVSLRAGPPVAGTAQTSVRHSRWLRSRSRSETKAMARPFGDQAG